MTLFGLLSLGAASADDAKPASRPNVLVVLTDEHNFRTLGCYRRLLPKEQAYVWGEGVAVETPHIDSLAARGLLCERVYAASPVCTPSRAAFLTGRYPQNTGADENDLPLKDDVTTFAEALRKSGYATGYAGKWHLDGTAKPGWAPARKFGFDDNAYMFNRGHWKQFEDSPSGPEVKARNAKGQPTYDAAGADGKSFATDFLADKAVAFIRRHAREPFCFVLSLPDPHGPNTVRPPYDTMYAEAGFKQPASAFEKGDRLPACAKPPAKPLFESMAPYFGMVKCIDDNVGKVLQALEEAGLSERTLVVFTADHGDMCGEHGRVNKGIPLEGSARIPLVMALPGVIQAGSVVREALCNVDFKPTLLGLLGLPQDPRDEGRDASALLLSGRPPEGWRDVACSRHSAGHWLMAVSSRHKLIVSTDSDPCLFDLRADPFELRNICFEPASRPAVRELATALRAYAGKCGDTAADQPALRADLAWACGPQEAYAAPERKTATADKRQRLAKRGKPTRGDADEE
jgi:arylsulfatase A-like enzyme